MNIGPKEKISASLEDYLEAIFNLAGSAEGVRSKDIAERLGVARSSVTGALQLLRDKGLANYQPYACVTLTAKGDALAREVADKHDVLRSFFTDVLGVEAEVAQRAACRAEHALGCEIISRLVVFVEYVTASDRSGRNVSAQFRRFYRRRSMRLSKRGQGDGQC